MNNSGISKFNQARIEWAMRLKYSPMPELDMERLATLRNAARIGEYRDVGKVWEVMVEIDGELAVNADKRACDLSRMEWEVKSDGSTLGDQHAEALRYFYEHLTATQALDQDEVGGVNLLVYQTCWQAHLYKYNVHEMLLRVDNAGAKQVTAEFRQTPVWFMESRRGYLGYLQHIFDLYGMPCIEGEWFTCVGRGWMRALMTAYALKWFPLRDWLVYCQRYGSGFLDGSTDAEYGSAEWTQAEAAMESLANDAAVLHSKSTEFKFLDQPAKGQAQFEPLVDKVDRLYAKCLRGVDLATSSRVGGSMGMAGGKSGAGGGQPLGASVQQEESGLLLAQDVPWFNGYAQRRIDRPLIRYLFNQEPCAKFVLLHGEEEQSPAAADTQAWVGMGLEISKAQARERTGWREPEDNEPILGSPTPPPAAPEAEPKDAESQVEEGKPAAPNPQPSTGQPGDEEPRRYQKPNWQPPTKPGAALPAKSDDNTPIAAGADPARNPGLLNPRVDTQGANRNLPDPQVQAGGFWSRADLLPVGADGKTLPMPSLGYAIPNDADGRAALLAAAHADDLAPVADELSRISGIGDDRLFAKKLSEFIAEHGPLVALLRDINASPRAAKVLNDVTVKNMANALKTKAAQ